MKLEDLKCININGQDLYFLADSQIEQLRLDSLIGGTPLDSFFKERLIIERNEILSYPELSIGIGRTRDPSRLMLYTILEIDNRFQRVEMEHVTCPVCKIKILSANPHSVDSYIGLPKEYEMFSVMAESDKFPKKNCPNCRSELPRYSIWAVCK